MILVFHLLTLSSKFIQTLVPSVNKLYSECLMQKNDAGFCPSHCERLLARLYLMRISAAGIFVISPKRW